MIAQYPLIPDEAFLYFPQAKHITQMRNGTVHRIIFGGGVQFYPEQVTKINSLKAYISKYQGGKLNYLNGFTEDFLLRFLQACSFNNQECLEALQSYDEWQKKALPLQFTQNQFNIIKEGTMYVCGRDCYYRPIIVVDVKKILDLKIKQKNLLSCLGFFFQYIIQNCLIEGQVQNWNTIIDLGNCSVFSLSGTLVDIIKYMSNIFKARINHNYLVHCPSSIKMVWGMVKKALNEDQLRKISLSDKKKLKPQDFATINPNQVQQKYGGTRPDVRNFWPIQFNPYQMSIQKEPVKLVNLQQYDKLFKEGKLRERKIKRSFITKFRLLHKKSSNVLNLGIPQDKMTQKQKDGIVQIYESEQIMYPLQVILQKPQPLQQVFTYDSLFNSSNLSAITHLN